MDQKLHRRLLKTRSDIKKKFRDLKAEIKQAQSQLEKTYQPITKPLKDLLTTLEKTDTIKKEPTTPLKLEPLSLSSPIKKPRKERLTTPPHARIPTSTMLSTDETLLEPTRFLENEDVFESSPMESTRIGYDFQDQYIDETFPQNLVDILNETTAATLEQYLEQYSPITRTYVEGIIKDVRGEFDHVLGVVHDISSESYTIGDSRITFLDSPDPNDPRNKVGGPNFTIKNIEYVGTPGLYELMFKKNPIGYKKEDVDNYVDILRRSNALYVDHNPSNRRKVPPSDIKDKYMFIIAPKLETRPRVSSRPIRPEPTIATRSQTRKGGKNLTLMDLSNKKIQYRYFDNVNELISRLRLLIASKASGNTGLDEEIQSILEELRERKIIK